MEIKFTEGLIKYLESNPHIRKPIWKLALNLSTLYTVVCLIRMKYDFNRKRHIDSRYIGGILFKKFVKRIEAGTGTTALVVVSPVIGIPASVRTWPGIPAPLNKNRGNPSVEISALGSKLEVKGTGP